MCTHVALVAAMLAMAAGIVQAADSFVPPGAEVAQARGQSCPDLQIETIAEGLAYPRSLAFLPGRDEALITERPGRVRRLVGSRLREPLRGLPPVANLLDIAPAADFEASRQLYISLNREESNWVALEVWKARLVNDGLVDVQAIFRGNALTSPALLRSPLLILQAGRLLVIGPSELLISVADTNDRSARAQDNVSHWGKILLIREGREPRIVASGVRNGQGIAKDPQGRIWFTDHGASGGDELNVFTTGANYGWPLVSFGRHYDGTPIPAQPPRTPRIVMPITYWTPALAPSSLLVYNGREFPEWNGSLFVGSLAQRHLQRLELIGNRVRTEEVLLADLRERIRDVRVDARGRLYVLTDSLSGRVIRISRSKCHQTLAPQVPKWKHTNGTAQRAGAH